MEFKTFYAGQNDEGRRLDRVVRRFLSEENLSNLYKSIRNGLIKVNGKKAKPEYRIAVKDELLIAEILLSKKNTDNTFSPKTFSFFSGENILFKNESVIIINKPYDVSVQGKDSLAQQIASLWKQEKHGDESLSFVPGPLHRLDRKTTGVLVFSQNLQGAQWFSKAFSTHTIKKTYIALLQGKLPSKAFWRDFICKNQNEKSDDFHTVEVSEERSETGKDAITEAEPLVYGKYEGIDVTFAKIIIQTGRTHQIRSQAAFHGFPLLGDTAYGGRKINEAQDFYLHAYQLELNEENPLSVPKKVTAFISTNFKKMLDKTLIKSDSLLII